MLFLAVGVGILAGLAATLYRGALIISYRLFFSTQNLEASPLLVDKLLRMGLPVLGGLIVGALAYRVLKIKGSHGVPSLMKAVVTGRINLPPLAAAKSGLSVITIASGASAGPEGPIVEIGAVVGCQLGRWAKVTRERLGTLVGCGAASGIAAIFNAPLGGVFFALELILRDFTASRFSPVVLSAVIASVTTQILLPSHPVFRVPDGVIASIHPNFALILSFALLGPLCAAGSALYITGIYRAQDFFQRRVNLPIWIKPCLGGIIVGVIGYFFPAIQGEGYEFLNSEVFPITGQAAAIGMASILFFHALAKIAATSATLGSGFVGGAFAPALFIGGALGASFGVVANLISVEATPDPAVFALVGMAGGVAGALNAPFSAVLIVYEITGGRYQILLPLMITVALTVSLTRHLRHGSVYTLSLLREGFDIEAATQQRDPLAGLAARDIMTLDIPYLDADTPLQEILESIAQTDSPALCVRDHAGAFRGLIAVQDLRAVLSLSDEMGSLLLAGEIAEPHPERLRPDSPLSDALAIFSRTDTEAIPILDPQSPGSLAGVIFRRAFFDLYRERRKSAEGASF